MSDSETTFHPSVTSDIRKGTRINKIKTQLLKHSSSTALTVRAEEFGGKNTQAPSSLSQRVAQWEAADCWVSLIAEAVNADRVAEPQTWLSGVQAAVTAAAECKHEWPFVWTWQAEWWLSEPGLRSRDIIVPAFLRTQSSSLKRIKRRRSEGVFVQFWQQINPRQLWHHTFTTKGPLKSRALKSFSGVRFCETSLSAGTNCDGFEISKKK